MKITEQMFSAWKSDPVTKEIFSGLTELRGLINDELRSEGNILADNAQIKLARILGQREGIDSILNISYEAIGDTDDEDSTGWL